MTDGLVLCAGAIVRDEHGRLLLVRRANEPSAGLWSLPGGRVEPGETAAQAAGREVLEETGLSVDVGELLLTVTRGDYLIHDFAAVVTGGALLAGDDATEVRWCTPAELRSLETSPGLVEAIEPFLG